MPTEFIFRASDHTYWADGVEVPSYSAIAAASGIATSFTQLPKWQQEMIKIRGTHQHRAVEFMHANPTADPEIIISAMKPEWQGYVRAYVVFRKDHPEYDPQIIEKPMWGKLSAGAYGCTGDEIGLWNGQRIVVDRKNTKCRPETAIQTAAQSLAYHLNNGNNSYFMASETAKATLRLGLELHKDGSYEPHWFEDWESDITVFGHGMEVYLWKRKHSKA